MTKLTNEKTEKEKNREVIEEVLATGSESKTEGEKAVAHVEKEKIHTENEQISKRLEQAKDSRKYDDLGYLKQVREAASDYLLTIDPKDYPGWKVKVYVTKGDIISIDKKPYKTDRGLLGMIVSPQGKSYYRAVKCSFDPIVDTLAARTLALSIEESLDYFTNQLDIKLKKPLLYT